MLLQKINLKDLVSVSVLAAVIGFSAQAQTLKTIAGYQPTVLSSETEAKRLYDQLPTAPFKTSSGCFQRAHHWSYQLSYRNGVSSMKAFLFFTERYKREFDYEWMYHVAPLIPVKKADGSIEEMVFDPTFINAPSWATGEERARYDGKPIAISEWIKYFIFPAAECPIVDNYQDYFDYQERYYCYVMKTPMYTYIPDNIETETEVRTNFWKGDLEQMRKAYKLEYRF